MSFEGETFVVVGGGQAAAWIARTLRAEGFGGRLVLIGEEACWPYERPPLSKAFLQGKADAAALTLLDAARAEALRIERWRGQRVTAIDRAARSVTCTDGRSLGFGRLFLATGGRARMLPGLAGIPADRIHTLRSQADALRLRAALAPGGRLLVLGGGWIGLEVAATARGLGCAVTLLEAAPRLCARTLPVVAADYLRDLHEVQGVVIRTEARFAAATAEADAVAVALADGTVLRADHILVGIGMVPDTALAEACGLAVEDGILVDDQGRTSDPGIFAAGDVARHPSAFAGGLLRLESWANAQNQGIVVAKAALGGADRYAEIPWFWSDQYTTNLQVLGLPQAGERCVARGAPDLGRGSWLMLRADGRVAGAVAVNAARDLRPLRRFMAEGLAPCPAAWADPAQPLQRLPVAGAVPG